MTFFRSPIIKLTLWYLLIIMCISFFFSIVLYETSTNQVRQGLRRQAVLFRDRRFPFPLPYDPVNEELLAAQLQEIQERMRTILAIINGTILALAGSVSYLLAKRTLRPIEESLDAQRRFTADASHELRTPLTAMRTEIEVALRATESHPEEYQRVMKSALEEIQRLERLSHALLRLAQYEEQRKPLPVGLVVASAIIEDACRRISPHATAKHIAIQQKGADGNVLGEKESLAELLVILLDNAVKYSPEKTTIEISSSPSDAHRVALTIRDQGIGMKESDLEHIFDRFYRADSSRSKEHVDGHGLGLSIAKQIVEQHHGTIDVQSILGKGTTVTIILPRAAT
ncbi:MAG: HAMP domain-containing sensor histidine kinase [bacterium]